MYLAIKHLHMTFALISIIGFMVRGILSINQHRIMEKRWLKIAPHVIDTGLLISAIALAFYLQANPFVQTWLLAKIIALVIYIGLGTIVIKRKGNLVSQWGSYIAAILVFGYIVSVAVTKSPSLGP